LRARVEIVFAGDVPVESRSPANQLADQQRVADAKGFVIVRTEVDNDISALNGKHRPGYEAVMAAAARGHEAAVVRQMFTRFHAGDSLRGIVTRLTAQGVPTRSGRARPAGETRSQEPAGQTRQQGSAQGRG
jgi:hypothetical protein